jgi:hypothetical protein
MLPLTNLKPTSPSSFADTTDVSDKATPCRKADHSICKIPEYERIKLITIGAYLLAEKRNFAPGHEDDDWFAAEDSFNKYMY